MTPEQKARVSIDALLVQAGWHVCNVADANIHASLGLPTALPAWRRPLPFVWESTGFEFHFTQGQYLGPRAQPLRQTMLTKAFSA
jgi:type I restriction enzyme R subunit